MFIQRIAAVFVFLAAAVLQAQTAWLPPVTVATTAGTSASILLNPQLAAAADGDLSGVWTGHWGTNETTHMLTYTAVRHSDVYAAHSVDSGNSWTSPTQISDSRFYSTFAKVISADSGAFHYSYTSGDSFTGFRFHTVTTANGGAIYTSNTLLQNLLDLNEGFLYPNIVSAGSSLVAGWTGIHSASFSDPLLAQSGDGGASWSYTQVPDAPANLNSPTVIAAPTIAADGLDVVAPHTLTWQTNFTFPAIIDSEVFLMISRDGGESWTVRNDVTSSTFDSSSPYVAADGNGNWLLFWQDYSGEIFQNSKLYLQKSVAGWNEWTTPSLIAAASPAVVTSAATDGDGRWLVLLRGFALGNIRYIWSEDNGETWSSVVSIPDTRSSLEGDSCAYLGDGQWGVIWAENAGIKLSKLQWGNSAVGDWVLY